jgi:hypothetical protein
VCVFTCSHHARVAALSPAWPCLPSETTVEFTLSPQFPGVNITIHSYPRHIPALQSSRRHESTKHDVQQEGDDT